MRQRQRRSLRWLGFLCLGVLSVLVVRHFLRYQFRFNAPRQLRAAVQQVQQHGAEHLPVYGEVPAFTLTDQQGQTVTREALAGQVWIADFIFTRCTGQCLVMTTQMAELQHDLPVDIRLVSFSVDPIWDTPAVLSAYAARVGAEGQRWIFVTGSREAMHRLSAAGFHLSVAEEGGTPAEPIVHSVRLVLVDRTGVIRGYYDGTDAEAVARLRLDALALLRSHQP